MEKNEIQPFRFGIVEEKDDEVIIEVKQEDYEQDLAVGIPEDELLKPGKHKFRRRNKFATREELHPSNTKVEFQMKLDLDTLKYFQSQAESEEVEALQILLNEKLRVLMKEELRLKEFENKLLNDKKFIAAIAEEVKKAA